MKITHLVKSLFSISARIIDFLALFRFTEADACALLSAYGLNTLEVDRPQDNRPNEQRPTSGRSREGNPSQVDKPASEAYAHRCPSGFYMWRLDGRLAKTSRSNEQPRSQSLKLNADFNSVSPQTDEGSTKR